MMRNDSCAEERLKESAEQEIGRNPQSQGLVQAFLPLLVAQERFLADGRNTSASGKPTELDMIRFMGGIPMMRQSSPFERDDPWREMVHAVVEGLLEGFPNIRHELTRFESAVQSGRVAPCDFFTGKRGQREQRIHLWAQEIGIPPLRLLFILSHVKRMILDGRRKSLQGAFREADWHKGYCPFCGAFPGIALIDGTGRARRLHCFQCGQTWHFRLSVCPWCEGEGKEETAYFYIDDDDRGAAFACEKCRRYLITTRRQDDPGDCRLYFAAIGLAYLDLIMQQKGYLPMVDWGWNIFATYS